MISAIRTAMERAILFSIAVIFIVAQLTNIGSLTFMLGGLVFVAIFLRLPGLKGMTFWLTAVFSIAGIVLLSIRAAEAKVWFEAAGVNVTIVTLFLFAPLFGIPVRLPAYVESLKRFYEANLRSSTALFAGTQLLTQMLCVFINVGSIPVVYQMVFVRPRPGMSLLLANAMNRGFAGAILWSPYFAAMTLVTTALQVSWSSVLPHMLVLAIMSLCISLAVDFRQLHRAEAGLAEHPAQLLPKNKEAFSSKAEKKGQRAAFPYGLGLYLIASMAVVFLLERLLDLPMVLVICLSALLFPLFWCLASGNASFYRQGVHHHVTATLPALQKEIALFLSAGLFSGAIGVWQIGSAVPDILGKNPLLPVPVLFSVLTIVLIVGTSALGIHPIVLVTILAGGIDPIAMQMRPDLFAVLLLGSWAISNPVSPASAVNNLLAGLLKRSVFELASPNYKFAVCMGGVLLFYLSIAFIL